jgi:dipeptidyl-peptidase-3
VKFRNRSSPVVLAVSIALLAILSCAAEKGKEQMPRQYLVEQLDGEAVVQLYLDEFKDLAPEEKKFAYYLSMAAIVGRDIAYAQHHRDALLVRKILEGIIENEEGLKRNLYQKILTYAKRIWMNSGNYDGFTNRKIIPEFSREELREAALWAREAGAFQEIEAEEELSGLFDRLDRVIFDPEFEPVLTNRNPAPGVDLITGSANNLYSGVTLAEVEAFDEKYPLNSRVAKVKGKVIEQVYRAGGDETPRGLCARELGNVVKYLERALPLAPAGQREVIENLIAYFKTGESEYRERADIAWVRTDPKVDLTIGFIEVYLDPRAVKGEYQALVTVRDEGMTQIMRGLAQNAQYFEDRTPWDEKYKKKDVVPPVAAAVKVLVATGDAGPVCPGGVNLPNGQAFREKYGSKSIMLTNVLESVRAARGTKLIDEFSADARERDLLARYQQQAGNLLIAMHEVLGHGSGKVSQDLEGDPSLYLKEYYNTLEEARADLVGLWHAWDGKLAELGVAEPESVAEAMYREYVMRDLTNLATVPEGDRFEEDHHRGRHMVVSFLMEKGAVGKVVKEGKIFYVVVDIPFMREGVGELLTKLMRAKGEGDYDAVKGLVEKYGTTIDTALRDQVVTRVNATGLPRRFACIMPDVAPVPDSTGAVVDVYISYPLDFTRQMMEYSLLE